MDLGYKLLKKHALQNTDELLALQQTIENELTATLNLNETIARLEQEMSKVQQQMMEEAKKAGTSLTVIPPIAGLMAQYISNGHGKED